MLVLKQGLLMHRFHPLPRWLARASLCGAMCFALLSSPARAEPHTFELLAPSANEVYLAGEMTDWDQGKLPMHKGADGTWRVNVDLARGQWIYKFVVDGKWMADPRTADQDADGQGGQHSFLFIGKGEWDDKPQVSKGRIDTFQLASRAWGKPMKVNVYLPPGFERGKPYSVLWLLHGRGMDADQWLRTGRVNRYMDNLLASGAIHAFVIVMPSSEDLPYTGKSEQFITDELPAWLGKTYGLRVDRAHSGVAGMSMGGSGAFSLPLSHHELYGFSFALSGYYSDDLIAALPMGSSLPMQVVLLCGNKDELVGTNRKLVQALNARQAKFYYREDAGAHSFHYWSNRMVEMLTAADSFFSTGQIAKRPIN